MTSVPAAADADRIHELRTYVALPGKWDGFRADPRWAAIRQASSTGDQIISSFESRFLTPLDITAAS